MTILCLDFLCRQYFYWGVLSAPQNTEFLRYFIVFNIIWCPWNVRDFKPLKNSSCVTFAWQDDIDAYKTQNQFLNSEIHQVTRLWTSVAENEKALLMKVRPKDLFSWCELLLIYFRSWHWDRFWFTRNKLSCVFFSVTSLLLCVVPKLDMIILILQQK